MKTTMFLLSLLQAEESDESESEEEEEEEDDDEDKTNEQSLSWKSDLAQRAAESFYKRQSSTTSLRKLVYGVTTNEGLGVKSAQDGGEGSSSDEEAVGGMFKVMAQNELRKSELASAMDQMDTTKFHSDYKQAAYLQNWGEESVLDAIRSETRLVLDTGTGVGKIPGHLPTTQSWKFSLKFAKNI